LNKLEFLISKDFDWIWSDIGSEEDFLNISSVFLLFRYYLPLEKGYPLPLNKLESTFTHEWFVPSLVKIGQVVLEKKSKM
jgi:hypothetical protein